MFNFKNVYLGAVLALLMILAGGLQAHATLVDVSGGGTVARDSKHFEFQKTAMPQIADSQDANFDIYLSDFTWHIGDYLAWDMEGVISGSMDSGTSDSWTISHDAMSSILADGVFNLTIDYYHSNGFNSWVLPTVTESDTDWGTTGGKFVWELTYESSAPVPEPATILLMGLGLAGLGVMSWKRKNS